MKRERLFLLCLIFGFMMQTIVAQHSITISLEECPAEAQKIVGQYPQKKKYKDSQKARKEMLLFVSKLRENQYLSANLDTVFLDDNQIKATIYVGQRLNVNQVRFSGLDSTLMRLLKIDKLIAKTNFNTIETVVQTNKEIVCRLENNGFPFAQANIENIDKQPEGLEIEVVLASNEKIIFDSIIKEGNLKLGNSFLYGYLGLKRKGLYNEKAIKKVNNRLQDLAFLTLTRSPGVSFSKDRAALYLFADKSPTNQFDGILGIVPNDETSGKVLLTGNLNLNLSNVFAVGETIKLSWNRTQVQSQTLDVSLDFPYLFFSCFGIDGNFNLDKKDTSYVGLNFGLALRYYLEQNNYLRTFYNFENSRLNNNESLKTLTALPSVIDFNLHWYGLELVLQKLDYLFNPRKGYDFKVNVAIGQKNIQKNANLKEELYQNVSMQTTQLQATTKLSIFVPIKKRWTWLFVVEGGIKYAEQLYDNEQFKIGGLNSIRGFDQQSIYASTYALFCNELRFIFGKKSYLQAFFDLAWYENKTVMNYRSDIPFGFGLGISFDTKAGIFAFNYALGKQLNNPIKLSNGKITFGYTALF